jgi:hypothetical protein
MKTKRNENARDQDIGQTRVPMECLDDDAVNKILESLSNVPNSLDRVALKNDLNQIPNLMRAYRDFSSRSFRKANFRTYAAIKSASDELLKKLQKEQRNGSMLLREIDGSPPNALPQFITNLSQLSLDAKRAADYWSDTGAPSLGSSFVWLIGAVLATCFERHFGSKAGIIRDPHPRSAYIDFVVPTLAELRIAKSNGTPYSLESIAKALYDFRQRHTEFQKYCKATNQIHLFANPKQSEI